MTDPLISVSHLTKAYGHRVAVQDVSFHLTAGVTGLLGPNGAGKSTIVRCLAGLCGWDDGDVQLGGVDPARRARLARRAVGFMPERVSFPPEMRVRDYLSFVASAKSIRRGSRSDAVETALGRAGLQEVSARIVNNLSKGYRQRVGLAQAILGEPPILILDEPTAGLDPLNMIEIRDVLRSYAKGRAVLVSTHNLPETRQLCDRVLVMSQGRLVYDGPPAEMASTGAPIVTVRVRPTGPDAGHPVADGPGTILVQSTSRNGEYDLLVEAKDEVSIGNLVARLSGTGWLVVGVAPATDALEGAFREAVLGSIPLLGAGEDVNP